ncbi:uncharacterized protein LOC106164500 [Lingula anatina]|uniref:Uncharacterized protein LOC106164500 n=1 Tax=Lingula anatina TaxID=7574 RepID=A0A1S3IIE1_LINAN|nr:uncharacterized protein LOC106164500 [Lingula anatina]|eukprot:XP_013397893.1 uncharacterized protein LOC106164500 [Lingula anatina]
MWPRAVHGPQCWTSICVIKYMLVVQGSIFFMGLLMILGRTPMSVSRISIQTCDQTEGTIPSKWSTFSLLASATYKIVKPRNYTNLESKRFAYMVLGPRRIDIEGLQETIDRDVFWVTFKDKSGDIFSPRATHNGARNALLHYVVNMASHTLNGGYLYYIFMDDDIVLSLRNDGNVNWKPWKQMKNNTFERFEDFLLDFRPAVGYVRFQDNWRQPTDASRSTDLHHDFDECFNAFHKDTLSFLLPYDTHFDYDSWYTGGWIARHHMGMLYHSYRMQCNSLYIDNTIHGGRSDRYKAGYDYAKARDYIKSAIKPTSTMLQKSVLQADSEGKGLQPIGRMPGEPKVKGDHSYLITDEFISSNFIKYHPMIQKIMSWRKTPEVERILHLRTRNESRFIPDSLYTDSPTRFWVPKSKQKSRKTNKHRHSHIRRREWH